MVHLASKLAAKPDLSSASRTPVVEISDPYKLSSDYHTCTVAYTYASALHLPVCAYTPI